MVIKFVLFHWKPKSVSTSFLHFLRRVLFLFFESRISRCIIYYYVCTIKTFPTVFCVFKRFKNIYWNCRASHIRSGIGSSDGWSIPIICECSKISSHIGPWSTSNESTMDSQLEKRAHLLRTSPNVHIFNGILHIRSANTVWVWLCYLYWYNGASLYFCLYISIHFYGTHAGLDWKTGKIHGETYVHSGPLAFDYFTFSLNVRFNFK